MTRYQLENARLQRLYAGREFLGDRAGRITESDRIRLQFVDDHASSVLIRRWLDGGITWVQLWRVASECPGEHEAQAAALVRKR